jgi:hypothetical protein
LNLYEQTRVFQIVALMDSAAQHHRAGETDSLDVALREMERLQTEIRDYNAALVKQSRKYQQ